MIFINITYGTDLATVYGFLNNWIYNDFINKILSIELINRIKYHKIILMIFIFTIKKLTDNEKWYIPLK